MTGTKIYFNNMTGGALTCGTMNVGIYNGYVQPSQCVLNVYGASTSTADICVSSASSDVTSFGMVGTPDYKLRIGRNYDGAGHINNPLRTTASIELITNSGSGAITMNLSNTNNTVPTQVAVFNSATTSTSTSTGALVVAGGVGINGNEYIGGSLYLPTSGGTQSALNYYEEYTGTTTFSLIWASGSIVSIYIVRIGAMVNLIIKNFSATTNTSSYNHFYNSGTTIPARFCPTSSNPAFKCLIQNGANSLADGYLTLSSGGLIVVTLISGNFTTGTTCGLSYDVSLSYSIL